MTMYASVNTKSKKELNDRIATGETILLRDITPFGDKNVTSDGVYPGICGPHYPQPPCPAIPAAQRFHHG